MAKKKPYRFFVYLIARAAAFLLMLLPRPLAMGLAKAAGNVSFSLVSRQREKALKSLRQAFGNEKTEAEIQIIARGVFQNFAQTAVEILRLPRLSKERLAGLVDLGDAVKVYESLLSEGKGLIAITAHIGNWELLAGAFGLMGFRGAVIARKIYYEPYNRWIVGLRQSIGVPTIYREGASREILKVLGRGEVIGIVPDQDIDSLRGVFVDFFGRPAYTPVAPVRLALQFGTPILPNFLIRQKDGRYKIILGDVIRPSQGDRSEASVTLATAQWMRSFEEVIRQYPDQWGWMHDRWKTQPEPECLTSK
ncbi:MAG: lysophospholipid acyltransferase family protein [Candidatus Omnitrophica bacterium]|nr:lysophospholipid acyltransferase family protein [Candidatus Omnitrophota bacterium]